jgi:hypothetical protein
LFCSRDFVGFWETSAFGKPLFGPFVDGVTRSRRRTSKRKPGSAQGPGKGRLFSKDCTLTSNVKADDRGGISGTNRCFRCDAAEQVRRVSTYSNAPGAWMAATAGAGGVVSHASFIIRQTRSRDVCRILKRLDYLGVISSSSALNGGGRID